jgi:hypothetical protein
MKSFLRSAGVVSTIALLGIFLAIFVKAAEDAKPAPYAGKPYDGKPQTAPGIIQAEYYDVAPGDKNGIAYNRRGEPKSDSNRATGDSVGLATIGSDHVSTTGEKQNVGDIYVGWTDPGDWWKYTISVKEAGAYAFGGHFAAGAKGAKISVTFTPLKPAGAPVTTGPFEIPTTAGFQPGVEVYHVWELLDNLAKVELQPGLYVMTVKVEAVAGLNIDYYSLTRK